MKDITEEQVKLRKQLRLLSVELSEDAYQQKQFMFGRVATIVEAITTDPEQRKATKDLLSNAIYNSNGLGDDTVASYQLKQLALAQGFELWDKLPEGNQTAANAAFDPVNKYEKI